MISVLTVVDLETAGRIADLVNLVYGESEQGLWKDGAQRTDVEEIIAFVKARELAVAWLGGLPAGAVRIQQLDPDTGAFGMLAADPAVRGRGVGRELVRFAEDICRERGSTVMRLELLVPRGWVSGSKELLRTWYTRLGYQLHRVGTIDEDYPRLAPQLAGPADYQIYLKRL